jgi:acetyl esterase/lipase
MDVKHHADYLSHIATKLNVPLISVEYRKAPEYPYPSGVNDCYKVYKAIVQSNGACVGINTNINTDFDVKENLLRFALLGDSAGGNFCASVTLKALTDGIRTANGIHLIYPSVDMASEIWKTAYGTKKQLHELEHDDSSNESEKALKHNGNSAVSEHPHAIIQSQQHKQANAVLSSQSSPSSQSTTLVQSVIEHASQSHPHTTATAIATTKQAQQFNPFGQHIHNDNPNRPLLTSKALYAFDGVLPMRYMILIAQALFRNGGDPVNDYFASPLRAPTKLLAAMPPVYIHVGSVDPLSDDSIFFIDRIKQANEDADTQLHLVPGVSHAYMQITTLLPEGRQALDLSCKWLNELLDKPSREAVTVHVQIPETIPELNECHCDQSDASKNSAVNRVAGQRSVESESNSAGDKVQLASKL